MKTEAESYWVTKDLGRAVEGSAWLRFIHSDVRFGVTKLATVLTNPFGHMPNRWGRCRERQPTKPTIRFKDDLPLVGERRDDGRFDTSIITHRGLKLTLSLPIGNELEG